MEVEALVDCKGRVSNEVLFAVCEVVAYGLLAVERFVLLGGVNAEVYCSLIVAGFVLADACGSGVVCWKLDVIDTIDVVSESDVDGSLLANVSGSDVRSSLLVVRFVLVNVRESEGKL